MIREINQCFVLDTKHSSYIFHVLPTGHLEHLHYGRKIYPDELAITQKNAFSTGHTIAYEKSNSAFTLENIALEISSLGKGDLRETFIELEDETGNTAYDFLFDHYVIDEIKEENELPGSYHCNEHLCISLKDRDSEVYLELHYYVYPECDVITRNAKVINETTKSIVIHKLMSYQLDLEGTDYKMTTFNGAWVREMKKNEFSLTAGKHINSSISGTSSHHANPFIMVSKYDTNENYGDCYGFNLIYSGNHYECGEGSVLNKTRIVGGINPATFRWQLLSHEQFVAPEGIFTYSSQGYNEMSNAMHQFIRNHIVRGKWQFKERPVLLNSWEAFYFKINENNIYDLAKDAKKLGIELFVVDDGWFGNRNDDTTSLGDWYVNKEKFPHGLSHLADKIHHLDLLFGLWLEPEMVSEASQLYEQHPEWTLRNPDRHHSVGRNQMILDYSNLEVQDYIIEKITDVLIESKCDYVKWDMNRNFSDYYSQSLQANQMGELNHRYILGLYHVMKVLTDRFPDILFEGCSAGGNRFDLGILSYFPQIWASDNTDALCRSEIQNNYSYGYPQSVMSAHVSSVPNHQTLRRVGLESRFNIASFGLLGYECNIHDASKEDLNNMKKQIEFYKQYRQLFQFGRFYRLNDNQSNYHGVLDTSGSNITAWNVVNQEKDLSFGMILQKLVIPNFQNERFKVLCLEEDTLYHFYNKERKYNILEFGDLVNTVAPVHVKQDSTVHRLLSKYIQLDGEVEDVKIHGSTLMYHGVALKQAFASQGFSNEVRHFPDFASRMYIIEKTADSL